MTYFKGVVKSYYQTCDKQTEFMLGVIDHNKRIQSVVVNEFELVRKEKGLSQESAISEIKANGGFISRQNLCKVKNGVFDHCSTTYLNILSRWCGYSDLVALVNAVNARAGAGEKG